MNTDKTLAAIEAGVVRVTETGHRSHLGASVIGKPCSRELWYIFRWVKEAKFEGRILRLFERGNKEEFVFEKLLKDIGCQVWTTDSNGDQFRIADCYGHFKGSLDGVAKHVPDVPPDEPCLAEFKTHNDKSFKKLEKEGLKKAKFEHYVQTQIYMYKRGLNYCLYMAVNKNDDHLFLDIVLLDADIAIQHIGRASDIIFSELPPRRINESPAWWQCRFCNFHGICHGNEGSEINCRTCRHSQPVNNGKWHCNLYAKEIPKEVLKKGCAKHDYIYSLTMPVLK